MDHNRRKFLKIILFGGGALIVGKILSPLFSKSSSTTLSEQDFSTFKVIEDKRFLSIYDSSGEEVLQIDKSG